MNYRRKSDNKIVGRSIYLGKLSDGSDDVIENYVYVVDEKYRELMDKIEKRRLNIKESIAKRRAEMKEEIEKMKSDLKRRQLDFEEGEDEQSIEPNA